MIWWHRLRGHAVTHTGEGYSLQFMTAWHAYDCDCGKRWHILTDPL